MELTRREKRVKTKTHLTLSLSTIVQNGKMVIGLSELSWNCGNAQRSYVRNPAKLSSSIYSLAILPSSSSIHFRTICVFKLPNLQNIIHMTASHRIHTHTHPNTMIPPTDSWPDFWSDFWLGVHTSRNLFFLTWTLLPFWLHSWRLCVFESLSSRLRFQKVANQKTELRYWYWAREGLCVR